MTVHYSPQLMKTTSSMIHLSVVVITYNEEDNIERCLKSIVKHLIGNPVHCRNAIANRLTLRQAGRHRGRNETIISIQRWRRCAFFQANYIIQLNHMPFPAADVERSQIERFVPILSLYLADDLILFAVHDKISKSLTAKAQL